MKILLLTALIFTLYPISAQISVSSADFGNSGDTVRMSSSANLEIDFSATGEDQIWDYSDLIAESQFLKQFNGISDAGQFAGFLFGQFASPKYQASYFNESSTIPIDQVSQFLSVPIESFNLVSRLTADSLTSIGSIISVNGNFIPVKSDTIETRYDFPLNYGDTHFSRGYTYLDLNPIQNAIWIQHRTRSTEVDGWGVISTPLGTFNALRVRHDITESDSLYIDFSGFGFWVPVPVPLTHEYEWWTNGQKEPLLKITTNVIQGNETVTAVEYRDIYRGLDAGLLEENVSFSLFPNPTNGISVLRTETPVSSLKVVEISGRVVLELNGENKTDLQLDLQEYSNGMYYLEGVTAKGIFRTRILRY
jgi:hypothetical protein